jgi:hypothetical protein
MRVMELRTNRGPDEVGRWLPHERGSRMVREAEPLQSHFIPLFTSSAETDVDM